MHPSLNFSGRLVALALLAAVIIWLTHLFGPVVPAVLGVGLMLYAIFRMAMRVERKPRMHAGLPILMLAFLLPAIAFAAETAPETVAQATSDTTKIVWGWGATATQLAQAAAWVLASAAMVLLRKLPSNIVAIFGNARVELLLNNAIGYGLNAVSGAVKGKTLEVDVGSKVLAQALQYAIDNAPAWLQSWAGGPEGLAKKIWARLNLGEGADESAVTTALAQVHT